MYEMLEEKRQSLESDFYGRAGMLKFDFFEDAYNSLLIRDVNNTKINDETIMLFMNSIWDNTLSIGIGNLDSDHKEIFNNISKLIYYMKEKREIDEITEILNNLEECVIRHLNEEEAIQKQYNYPKYDLHSKEHEKLRNELYGLREALEEDCLSPLFIINMYRKMFKWYRTHILDLDKEFGEYLLIQVGR